MEPLDIKVKTEHTDNITVPSKIKSIVTKTQHDTKALISLPQKKTKNRLKTAVSIIVNQRTFYNNIDYKTIIVPSTNKRVQKHYTCIKCNRNFKNACKMWDHFLWRHTPSSKIECNLCKSTLKNSIALREHNRIHHRLTNNEVNCNACNKVCKNKRAARRCERKHTLKVYKYNCDFCELKYNSKGVLEKHKLLSHPDEYKKEQTCDQCQRTYKNGLRLSEHIRTVHSNNTEYKCSECGKEYLSTQALHAHKRSHQGFICEQCGKVFSSLDWHKKHMLIHANIRPFSCSTCEKTFTTKTTLRVHTDTHTKVKRHECKVCGKRFSQRSPLIIHMRRHTGEKPYVCDLCLDAFVCKSMLNNHRTSQHKISALKTKYESESMPEGE